MTLEEIENLVRREIADEVGNDKSRFIRSWQIVQYANEAEREAAIRGRLLIDSTTSEVCSIAVTAGECVYPIDERVVMILRGKITGQTLPLMKVPFLLMDEKCTGWEDHEGVAKAFVTGMDKGRIRLYPTPVADGTLNLTVVRTPLNDMANTSDIPEIPARLHPYLSYWIKHRVYMNQDSEFFDKNRGDVNLQLFEQKFGANAAELHDMFDAMNVPDYTPDSVMFSGDDSFYF